jgi:hypothetical protein
MVKVKYVTSETIETGEIIETVLIDKGNGEFTSMLKTAYDQMLAANEAQA